MCPCLGLYVVLMLKFSPTLPVQLPYQVGPLQCCQPSQGLPLGGQEGQGDAGSRGAYAGRFLDAVVGKAHTCRWVGRGRLTVNGQFLGIVARVGMHDELIGSSMQLLVSLVFKPPCANDDGSLIAPNGIHSVNLCQIACSPHIGYHCLAHASMQSMLLPLARP
jgi:hypothetical protein